MSPVNANAIGFAGSFVLALTAVLILSRHQIVDAFIVFGQGHFLLAYLYQWRAGKVGHTYLTLYATASFVLILGLACLPDIYEWSLIVAGTIFAAHFFFDEYFIHQISTEWKRQSLGVVFIALFCSVLVQSAFGISFATAAIVLAIAAITLFVMGNRETVDIFFLGCTALLAAMLVIPWILSIEVMLGFIVLFHYARWYTHFYFRLRTHAERFREYVRDVVVINGFIVALFAVFVASSRSTILVYMFAPTYFYAWTILHVLFSVRVPPWFRARVPRFLTPNL